MENKNSKKSSMKSKDALGWGISILIIGVAILVFLYL